MFSYTYFSFEQFYDKIEERIKETINSLNFDPIRSDFAINIDGSRCFNIRLKKENGKIIITDYNYSKNDEEEFLEPMYIYNYFKLFIDSPNLNELLN
jgi:hypothetical protein